MRRWWLAGACALVLVLLGLVVAAWRDLNAARSHVNRARAELNRVVKRPSSLRTPDGRAQALRNLDAARAHVGRADGVLRGSTAIRTLGALPVMSRQRAGAIELVNDARVGVTTSETLLTSLDELSDRTELRGGTVPLSGLEELERRVLSAAGQLERMDRSSQGLMATLGKARTSFNELARSTATRLRDGAEALSAARSFMGAAAPRKYLVAVQNNAEMRDQGMILSYAVVRFDAGSLTLERSGRIGDLELDKPAPHPIPDGTKRVFGAFQPTLHWTSVNATADFAFSGSAMTQMYTQATGDHVDGVIAIDVPGLAALLSVVGPVDVEGIGQPISASNAARVLLHELYETYPRSQQATRKDVLERVPAAIVEKLQGGSYDGVALGHRMGDAAAGGHLRLFSLVEAEEEAFERSGLGGGPGVKDPERTFHVSIQNGAGNKLDYYLDVAIEVNVSLTALGAAVVDTSVRLQNNAPRGAPPSYQLGPVGVLQESPGQYIANAYLWGPAGAVQARSLSESGLRLTDRPGISVEPGEEKVVNFQTVIRDAVRENTVTLRFVPQPRLRPMRLDIRMNAPRGGTVDGPPTRKKTLDRTETFLWRIST